MIRKQSKFREAVLEWISRYGPAELVAVSTAMTGYFLVFGSTGSEIAAAFGGAVGDNVGYYGTILIRDFRQDRRTALINISVPDRRTASESGANYGVKGTLKTIKNIFLEFGFSEILDMAIIRPLTMGLGARYIGNGIGIFVGKIVADVIFYIPTIMSYEFRQHFDQKEIEDQTEIEVTNVDKAAA